MEIIPKEKNLISLKSIINSKFLDSKRNFEINKRDFSNKTFIQSI